MENLTAVVVVPIYAKTPKEIEARSLLQGLKVLKNYPFIFMCPESLDYTYYEDVCKKNGITNFAFFRFEDKYFKSAKTYDLLLLRDKFYSKFSKYDYMLIYQLDAWVFRDELMEWCKKGYDYIGPPWFIGQDKSTPESGFMEYSGNGGFSLRNIRAFRKVIHTCKIIKSPAEVLNDYAHLGLLQRLVRLPFIILRTLGWRNNYTYARNLDPTNEDNYWANVARKIDPVFKVAKAEEAISFGFESHPAKMLELNKGRLPFGCHAFLKCDYDFWKPYLEESYRR